MYDTLLVPTDGSTAALDAAKHAYSLGERYDAEVHVLAVIEETESASIVGQGTETLDTLYEHGSNATQQIVEDARSRNLETVGVVKVGNPDRAILDYATTHDINLIIMSTHGRAGVKRFLHGSITEQVLRNGDTPVLIVPR